MIQIVWFKRDLRVEDHEALGSAAGHGPVLPLYIVEPDLWRQPDSSARQWAFYRECLDALRDALAALGQPLVIRRGDAACVLRDLVRSHAVTGVWSHQETGNAWSYRRDERVRAYLAERSIAWHELPQNGVVRRLASRDGWSRRWEARMSEPRVVPPAALLTLAGITPGELPGPAELGLAADPCPGRQPGGRRAGLERLGSFLNSRGESYHTGMSSPVTAWDACSRLSPYLAWGNLSIRQVVQASRRRSAELKELRARGEETDRRWLPSLNSFSQRLHWHCHFIQKLEDEPAIEFHNMNRAFDGLREDAFDVQRFQAWCAGQTGYPMVDACMRALARGGWINFRMRAMLASFASHHLWLHWRPTAQYLARLFLDFEPGIHFSQMQMQAGTTGINTVRIYSPAKQVLDQDPKGVFIRRYCPELEAVPDEFLAEPQRMPLAVQRRAPRGHSSLHCSAHSPLEQTWPAGQAAAGPQSWHSSSSKLPQVCTPLPAHWLQPRLLSRSRLSVFR